MKHISALVTVLMVTALACAGCLGRPSGAKVEIPGTIRGSTVEGAARIHSGQPVSIGMMDVCLDRPGSATIDGVALLGPAGGGIKVDDWTLVRHPQQSQTLFVGTDRRTLRSYGRPLTHSVDLACREHPARFDELVVQVERTDSQDAGFRSFAVHWSSDGRQGILLFPLGIELCNGRVQRPGCRSLHMGLD